VEAFVSKVVQLHETTHVRHGLMLVGPAGGGKTCCYRALAAAMNAASSYPGVRTVCLNPKAVTMGQVRTPTCPPLLVLGLGLGLALNLTLTLTPTLTLTQSSYG